MHSPRTLQRRIKDNRALRDEGSSKGQGRAYAIENLSAQQKPKQVSLFLCAYSQDRSSERRWLMSVLRSSARASPNVRVVVELGIDPMALFGVIVWKWGLDRTSVLKLAERLRGDRTMIAWPERLTVRRAWGLMLTWVKGLIERTSERAVPHERSIEMSRAEARRLVQESIAGWGGSQCAARG